MPRDTPDSPQRRPEPPPPQDDRPHPRPAIDLSTTKGRVLTMAIAAGLLSILAVVMSLIVLEVMREHAEEPIKRAFMQDCVPHHGEDRCLEIWRWRKP